MAYSKNSGYGQQILDSLPFAGSGKHLIVGDTSTINLLTLQEIFTFDPDGVLRFYTDIDSAINATVADAGDNIWVMPGHTETISGASGITADVAGVSIFGIGNGAEKPTITFSATASTFVISASSVSVSGLLGVPSIDNVVNAFVVTGDNCNLDLEWRDASNAVEATTVVRLDTADQSTLTLKHNGFTTGNGSVRVVAVVNTKNSRINIDAYGIPSTAMVNFITTASSNVVINGFFYVSGTTDLSKNVVDTIGGSTWFVSGMDGAAGIQFAGGSGAAVSGGSVTALAATLTVPSADAVTNTNERDVIGNKTDAAVTAVGTTKSIEAYVKGHTTMLTVQSADATNNAFAGDVTGNKTDASVYTPGTTKSIAAYVKGSVDVVEKCLVKSAATITNGQTLFTIAGGPIEIVSLVSVCVTANDGTASTLQFSADGTDGAATTISAASASLANAAAGATVILQGTTLATAPTLNANGPGINASGGISVIVPAGIITAVVGVGSTTGTWSHFLRFKPLGRGITVV